MPFTSIDPQQTFGLPTPPKVNTDGTRNVPKSEMLYTFKSWRWATGTELRREIEVLRAVLLKILLLLVDVSEKLTAFLFRVKGSKKFGGLRRIYFSRLVKDPAYFL